MYNQKDGVLSATVAFLISWLELHQIAMIVFHIGPNLIGKVGVPYESKPYRTALPKNCDNGT